MSSITSLTRKSIDNNHDHFDRNNNKQHCLAQSCEGLPSLELVLSEESSSSSSSSSAAAALCDRVPWDEPTISRLQTDVHWCPSKTCLVCHGRQQRQSATQFVPVPAVDVYKIRRLPQRWWIEDYCDPKVMESVLSTLFCVFSSGSELQHAVGEGEHDHSCSSKGVAAVKEQAKEQQTEMEMEQQSAPPFAAVTAFSAINAPFDEI